jgi:hypothetical protein
MGGPDEGLSILNLSLTKADIPSGSSLKLTLALPPTVEAASRAGTAEITAAEEEPSSWEISTRPAKAWAPTAPQNCASFASL